ncbi:MAG: DHH family phosphoesterase [bacterium]|nr:DHH family phosphoesterase [bacterium]
MNLTEKLQAAYNQLRLAKRVLIVAHTSPDADALASVGAMIEVARFLKLDIYAYVDKKPEGVYGFIPNEALVFSKEPEDLRQFDVILILDCGSISRTGLEARLRALLKAESEGRIVERPYLIEFDHHPLQEDYADLEIRLPDKASTTEIIYHFLKANNLEITKELANCILIGLMTDTGHFLHANSSQEAITVSSEMLLRGASLPKIIGHTVNNKNFVSLKVWGRALENMHFNAATGLISSGLTASELIDLLGPETAVSLDLFGDIVSFLSTLADVKVALLLREEGDKIKGSLRTNGEEIDVAAIARNFGGGGHKKAAGFSLAGRLSRTATGWKVIKQ